MAHFDKLPKYCAGTNLTDNQTILIKRGETGYWPAPELDKDEYNRSWGVTARQVAAMEYGSCFGWDIPLADPDCPAHDNLEEATA